MFKTKEQLIAYIEKNFDADDQFYVPNWFTKKDLRSAANIYIEEAVEEDPINPLFGTEELTDKELDIWLREYEDSRVWEWVDEESSNIIREILNGRDN